MTNSRASKGLFTQKIKTADQTVNSTTTLVDVTDLEFDHVSGKSYIFEVHLFVESSATPDFGVTANFDSGTGTGTWGNETDNLAAKVYGTVANFSSANWPQYIIMHGMFLSTGSGVLKIQFTQAVSDAAATSILKNSFIQWRQTD